MLIPFGEYVPDAAEQDSGVLEVAKNVYPTANGYSPIKALSAYSDALAADPKGLFLFRNVSGTWEPWAFTTTKAYQLSTTTWTDRSGAKTFAVPAGEFVQATQFGPEAIFTNYVDGLYSVNVDSGTNVAAVSGSPPTARCIDVMNGHVMIGSTGSDDYEVAWSDTEDSTNWSTGNAASQALVDGGRPMVICGAAGLVVQDRGITRVTFQPGDSKVFSFDLIESAGGTLAPNSVIKQDDEIAYLAEDGFWYRGEPIGHEKVARKFFATASPDQISLTQGVADPIRPIFYWIFHTSSTATTYPQGLAYNWYLKKWSELEFDVKFLSVIATPGVSPDSWTVSPDSEPTSPDSQLWAGGAPVMAGFDANKKLAFLDGTNLEATFETGDIDIGNALSAQMQMEGNRRAVIRSARLVGDTTSAVMNLRYKGATGNTGAWLASEVSQRSSGNFYFHRSGRIFRFRVRIPSSTTWSYARGIDITARRSGWQ